MNEFDKVDLFRLSNKLLNFVLYFILLDLVQVNGIIEG